MPIAPEPDYDKVTQASLNGLYVKAQELDRGHNEHAAPSFLPPGAISDVETHATTHASDTGRCTGGDADAETGPTTHAAARAGDAAGGSGLADADTGATARGGRPCGNAETHATAHASDR